MLNATPTTRPANDCTYRHISQTERAAKIRTLLKSELGASSRDISVRQRGGAINVDIRSCEFRKVDVERIAGKFEHVSRCESTGEILGGGNSFVFVEYADEATRTLRDMFAAQVAAASKGDRIVFCLDASVSVIWTTDDCWFFEVGDKQGHAYCSDGAIRQAVEAYLNLPRVTAVAS